MVSQISPQLGNFSFLRMQAMVTGGQGSRGKEHGNLQYLLPSTCSVSSQTSFLTHGCRILCTGDVSPFFHGASLISRSVTHVGHHPVVTHVGYHPFPLEHPPHELGLGQSPPSSALAAGSEGSMHPPSSSRRNHGFPQDAATDLASKERQLASGKAARLQLSESNIVGFSGSDADSDGGGGVWEDNRQAPFDMHDDEPPLVTRIQVAREKHIPVSKSELLFALKESLTGNTPSASSSSSTGRGLVDICNCMERILHAEHQSILEELRVDYALAGNESDASLEELRSGVEENRLKRAAASASSRDKRVAAAAGLSEENVSSMLGYPNEAKVGEEEEKGQATNVEGEERRGFTESGKASTSNRSGISRFTERGKVGEEEEGEVANGEGAERRGLTESGKASTSDRSGRSFTEMESADWRWQVGRALRAFGKVIMGPFTRKWRREEGGGWNGGTGKKAMGEGEGSIDSAGVEDDLEERLWSQSAERFERNFMEMLRRAKFHGLSARDLQLTNALNSDYLQNLPIEVDWARAASSNAIIFRRGYTTEMQEGLLIGAKFDYFQEVLLQRLFNVVANPLLRAGQWVARQWRLLSQEEGVQPWIERIEQWWEEPLDPMADPTDDTNGFNNNTNVNGSNQNGPARAGRGELWTSARKAVPRYEAVLSSAGSRGVLIKKLLIRMGLLRSDSSRLAMAEDSGSPTAGTEPHLRPRYVERISMRDIWLPASRAVCGDDKWLQFRVALGILFTRSVLQEPAFRELVLLYTKPAPRNGAVLGVTQSSSKFLQLYTYKDIPLPDLKVVFPDKKLSFRVLDALRLDLATIFGLLAFILNYRFEDFLSSPSAFVLDVVATISLGVFLARAILGYKRTLDRYQLLVNRTLYEKTLASSFGVVHFLVDASEEQQFKEAALVYGILLQSGRKPLTLSVLSDRCERFVFSRFGEQLAMPVEDAVHTLARLGLVMVERLSAQPLRSWVPCSEFSPKSGGVPKIAADLNRSGNTIWDDSTTPALSGFEVSGQPESIALATPLERTQIRCSIVPHAAASQRLEHLWMNLLYRE